MGNPEGASQHSIVKANDCVRIAIRGDFSADSMREVIALQDEVCGQYGYVLVLIDLRQSTGLSREVRRLGTEWGTAHANQFAVAMWGANLIGRALGALLHSAIGVLAGQRSRQAFFETENEAQLWLETQRARFKAATPA